MEYYYGFNQQTNLVGIMDERRPQEEEEGVHNNEVDSTTSSDNFSEASSDGGASSDSDLGGGAEDGDGDGEEVNSSGSDSSSINSGQTGPSLDMSSLLHQLPIKRGLSKHFQGKSQSFTSLSNVTSLEDLAKPENPYNKKLKSCRSYAAGLSDDHSHKSSSQSRLISKKTPSSRGSCSSLGVKRVPSCLGIGSKNHNNIPHPYGSRSGSTASFSSQTPLFA